MEGENSIEVLNKKIIGVEQKRDELLKKLSDYKHAAEFKDIQVQLEDASSELEKLNELTIVLILSLSVATTI